MAQIGALSYASKNLTQPGLGPTRTRPELAGGIGLVEQQLIHQRFEGRLIRVDQQNVARLVVTFNVSQLANPVQPSQGFKRLFELQ